MSGSEDPLFFILPIILQSYFGMMRLLPTILYSFERIKETFNKMKDLNNTTEHLKRSQPAKYRIKIQGKHNEIWSDWMDDLEINILHQDKVTTITVLTGIVKDQTGLHGLLNRIRDLGIPLVSVQYVNPLYFKKE